jgi:modulator of FtsH protease
MGYSYQNIGVVRSGADRATLVRRTYSLVFASVCVTVLGAWFGLGQPQMMQAVAQHPWITMLCTFAPLFLAMRARTAFPQNIVLVGLFAFVMGLSMSPLIYVLERTNPGVTGNAAALTLSTFGVLTGYAFVSKRDFSAWGSFFTIGLWVLIATSLLNFFFQSQAAGLWISAGTVLVFSGLLIFDTWRLRNVYGPDDYVMAAVQIYLDLLNMFMAILNLLGGGRRD